MRLEELENVFTYFYEQLVSLSAKHDRNVIQVRNKLKNAMEVDFYKNWEQNMENGNRLKTYSVYEFVWKIERILIGSHESRAHEPGPHMAQVVHRPREPPRVDWTAVGNAVGSAVGNAFSRLSGPNEWRSDIDKMFNGAQERIQKRQTTRANELIELRNAELEKWKKALQDGKGMDDIDDAKTETMPTIHSIS
jgi:hypothetical protein